MFDLKVINSVLDQLEDERGIPREKMIKAIEDALATAYRKEYGKKGQIIRAKFDINTGTVEFFQGKIVVDPSQVKMPEEVAEENERRLNGEEIEVDPNDERVRFNPEHHILIEDARRIKKNVELDEELVFPLEAKGDYGRIAAQTAKQVIIQKIREAEKISILEEYGRKEGEIVNGVVQRVERGALHVDLGRATGMIPYEEQIPGERYRPGERIRAYLYSVDDGTRGTFLRLSRSHPQFLKKLFELEAPELASGSIELKSVAREAGSRSKVAVHSKDSHIDPVGSLVGQRGVRVSTVMSELGGEKIDIIEWSADTKVFIADALSPAKVLSVTIDEALHQATVEVTDDQQSLAIGRGGQNVRLAAKLTGWKIDIRSLGNTKTSPETTEVEQENTAASKKMETPSIPVSENVDVKSATAEDETDPVSTKESV